MTKYFVLTEDVPLESMWASDDFDEVKEEIVDWCAWYAKEGYTYDTVKERLTIIKGEVVNIEEYYKEVKFTVEKELEREAELAEKQDKIIELATLERLIRKYGIPTEILNRINGVNEDEYDCNQDDCD